MQHDIGWLVTMNERYVSLVVLLATIKVIIFHTLHDRHGDALDFLGSTIVDFQLHAAFTSDIDSGRAEVNLPSAIDTLEWITRKEQVISSFLY